MRHKGQSASRTVQFIGILGMGIVIWSMLMTVIANNAAALSDGVDSGNTLSAAALQSAATITPTLQLKPTTSFSFTFANLGSDEQTLISPYDTTRYAFRLPENWAIESDALLELDLTYIYNRTNQAESPSLFGNVTVELDNTTVAILPIETEMLNSLQLTVPLPASILNDSNRTYHAIDVTLDAGFLCNVPHKARLIIHPTSSISLNYTQRPIVPDLARFPKPFYQRSFEADAVRFVLPSQPTSNDLSNAAVIAAKLGDLTADQMIISATTDSMLGSLRSLNSVSFAEHLIVVGQPHDNQFLPFLNDITDLPVSLHRQQLGLTAQGPQTVATDQIYTYMFTITNTVDRTLNLSVTNSLSPYADLVDCIPTCTENAQNYTITWQNSILAPNEAANFSLTLNAANVFTGTTLENTVTVIEADSGPLNAMTLTATVVSEPSDSAIKRASVEKNSLFFVFNGKAVAKEDGIIQEIVSPWNENSAILIVTGLSEMAFTKASYAMSSEAYFPGMNGPVALIQQTQHQTTVETTPATEMTFADLGYSDMVIKGGAGLKQVDFFFYIPYGWQLTDDALLELYFSHSQLLDYESSGITALINNQPVQSIPFSQETATEGKMSIGLKDANVRMGQLNRLTLEIDAAQAGVCTDSDQAWVLVKDKSKITLSHNKVVHPGLNLSLYPYPFHLNANLVDLLLVLPSDPTSAELEYGLQLAASLGDSASGKAIFPAMSAMSGDNLAPYHLEDYQIIAVGRPSRNALIQRINSQLPQPFVPGTDQIDQQLDNIVFRLSPDIDLGYVQLMPSIWNEDRAILAVTGTTDKSIDQAVDILVNRPWSMKTGNLTFFTDNKVNTIDTRKLTSNGMAAVVASAIPELTPVAEAAPTSTPTREPVKPTPENPVTEEAVSVGDEYPVWLILLVAATILIVIAIFAFVYWRSRR